MFESPRPQGPVLDLKFGIVEPVYCIFKDIIAHIVFEWHYKNHLHHQGKNINGCA